MICSILHCIRVLLNRLPYVISIRPFQSILFHAAIWSQFVSSRSFRFSCSFSCHLTWPRFSMHFCQRWLRLQVNSHCGRFLWSKHELVKVLTLNWRCWFQEKKSRLLRDVFELVWICEETAAFVVAWDLIQATHQMKEQIDDGVQLQQFSASKDPVSLLIPFSPYRCVS